MRSAGAQAATNPWQYAGGYKDASTGYIKFGARYYNPTLGRFTQADPSAQEINLYGYAAANPMNNTDPTGLTFEGAVASATIGTIFGVLGTLAGCGATGGIGCLVGGVLFGMAGGAIAGGLTAASDSVTGQEAGPAVLQGTVIGGITGFIRGIPGLVEAFPPML
ncbi:RHS repeat-associated core domain-containing protein [Arthrobacter sp. M4]|uniref:RHS repeat-associated core domain-containing protein n=1 Tax=Arthrobacter sp. M4 TaxID=218160 RepID=UPI001CDC9BF1|nr:RHS repeat-associated core domain-containing protein [Arthrobacter sp. M4]MCA4135312.1 RHS repeat-associated core domain-containing protein [Arthrobacter sp. M4]